MSDELDWELSDMFDNGLFAFPVYEQNSARRVVRYLLKRGVPDEEISSAIQGSTVDLHAWLNRRGKGMFGEWAMAWMNETRDLHKQTTDIHRPKAVYRNGSINDSDSSSFSRGSDSSSSSSSSDDSDGGGGGFFRSRLEEDDDLSLGGAGSSTGSSSRAFSSTFTGSTLDFHSDVQFSRRGGGVSARRPDVTSDSFTSVRTCKNRKHQSTADLQVSRSGTSADDDTPKLSLAMRSTDSGNVSDLCSCRSKSSSSQKDFKVVKVSHPIEVKVFCHEGKAERSVGGATADCRCKLAHYILRRQI